MLGPTCVLDAYAYVAPSFLLTAPVAAAAAVP